MKKKVLFAAAFMLATVGAYAQGNGIAGITEATNMVTSYFDPGTKLIYAVGAVVGLIGGVKVYSKFSSGDPDTSKTAASWFGACIFSQYLFIFAGGLLAILIAFMVLYMAGVNQWICIALGVISASVLVWATFHLNAKYGEWGLMKMQAAKNHPRYIINRKRFLRLIIPNLKNRKS